jgi:hypothetical protein
MAGVAGLRLVEPRGWVGGLRLLAGAELDLGGDQSLQRSPVDIDLDRARLGWHVVARLRESPAGGERPQRFELLGAELDLDLGPLRPGAALDGQKAALAAAAQAHLDLVRLDRQVALLDLLDTTTRKPVGRAQYKKLSLDFERQVLEPRISRPRCVSSV